MLRKMGLFSALALDRASSPQGYLARSEIVGEREVEKRTSRLDYACAEADKAIFPLLGDSSSAPADRAAWCVEV